MFLLLVLVLLLSALVFLDLRLRSFILCGRRWIEMSIIPPIFIASKSNPNLTSIQADLSFLNQM